MVTLVELASGREMTIGGPERGFQATSPTWAPDGQRVAVITTNLPGREESSATTALRVYGLDGKETAQLIAVPDLSQPDWGVSPA